MNDVHVADMTAHTIRARPRRSRLQSLIWVHRIGETAGRTVPEIARFFIDGEGARYTGATMAYHYVVTYSRVEQALPLDEQGAHARRWGNAHGIGIAVLGDFRYQAPTASQWLNAVSLCADLVPFLGRHSDAVLALLTPMLQNDLPIVGHGEVPGAYGAHSLKHHPDGVNACPGKHFSMGEFRADVERELVRRAAVRCHKLGHLLKRRTDERRPA